MKRRERAAIEFQAVAIPQQAVQDSVDRLVRIERFAAPTHGSQRVQIIQVVRKTVGRDGRQGSQEHDTSHRKQEAGLTSHDCPDAKQQVGGLHETREPHRDTSQVFALCQPGEYRKRQQRVDPCLNLPQRVGFHERKKTQGHAHDREAGERIAAPELERRPGATPPQDEPHGDDDDDNAEPRDDIQRREAEMSRQEKRREWVLKLYPFCVEHRVIDRPIVGRGQVLLRGLHDAPRIPFLSGREETANRSGDRRAAGCAHHLQERGEEHGVENEQKPERERGPRDVRRLRGRLFSHNRADQSRDGR